MQITIEIPQIKDFNNVNKLAKQVHELHVNWRPGKKIIVQIYI